MMIGTIIGNVWATRKHEALSGCKLMVVEPQRFDGHPPRYPLVAVDTIGAGIGEMVLVVSGSAARLAIAASASAGEREIPIDSVIVGIVDKTELPDS